MASENPAVRPVALIGSVIAIIFLAGIGLGYYSPLGWRALNLMVGLVAIFSFFGFLIVPGGWKDGVGFTEGRVRLAITTALVMLYITYFATGIFWFGTPEAQPSELSRTLFTTLANLLMVVVPFYFGATAATEIAKSHARSSDADSAV